MVDTIMLAKQYKDANPDDVYPAYASIKLDGVAARFTYGDNGWVCMSRQNKPIKSVGHICKVLTNQYPQLTDFDIIGELTVPGQPFKDAGGIIRRDSEDVRIVFNVYDMVCVHPVLKHSPESFTFRLANLTRSFSLIDWPIVPIPQTVVRSPDDVNEYLRSIPEEAEGIMIRPATGPVSYYKTGRSWGMLKLKRQETHDLIVLSVEEAEDKHGNPKGCVGRINCQYNGDKTGVGPGKLTAAERKYYWENQHEIVGKYIEVQSMPDPNYNKLREPRFIRMRPDKD